MRHVLLTGIVASLLASSSASSQPASIELKEAIAQYGPGIFPAVTQLKVCGNFRVLVVYWAGTDMLFVDEVAQVQNESTFGVKRGFSIREFNFYEASTRIREVSCDLKNSASLRVTGKAHDWHSERDYSFLIVMDTVTGTYRYTDTQR